MASSVKEDDHEEDDSYDKKASLKAARGPFLSIGATVLYALSAEFMALSSKAGIPGFQLLFFLRLTQLPAVLVCFLIFRPKLTGENRRQNAMLFLKSIISNISQTLVFLSFTYVTPGIALGIIQGSIPLFTACVGFIFLEETIGLKPCGAILTSVIGVVLISIGMANMETDSTHAMEVSILLPLAAAFTKGPDMVLARSIMKDTSGITMLLYIALLGTVTELILTYSFETPVWVMSAETAGYVVGLGLSQSTATLVFFAVLKIEKTVIAVAMRTLVIPFTNILDYFILSKVPSLLKCAGFSLVVLGTMALSINTWWEHRQDDKRRMFLKRMGFRPLQNDTE